MDSYRIGLVGGDGIGPEVVDAALVVLDAVEERFRFGTERVRFPWSGEHYLATGERFTAESLVPIRELDAVLLGAIGHPDLPRGMIEHDVIMGLRRGLDLFVNLRPIVLYDERLCPLKSRRREDVQFIVVRENTEDVYGLAGETTRAGTPDEAVAVEMRFTRRGIERVIRFAFELARSRRRKHLTLVDKANAIPIQELWRTIFEEVGAEYPDVTREAMYVDAAAMWMVLKPDQFEVIVTTNLFGDIITDLGAALCGGLGSGSSGNIYPGRVSVFEPIHGSAPKYAGKNVASPIGAIGALALMLDHIGRRDAAAAVNKAVFGEFQSGRIRGVDAGSGATMDVARIVAEAVRKGIP